MNIRKSLGQRENQIVIGICFLLSFAAEFMLQSFITNRLLQEPDKHVIYAVGLVAVCVTVLCLAAFLRKCLCNNAKMSLIASLGRVALTGLLLILCVIVISLLNGLIAVLLYALLKNALTIDQIKGIIDWLTTILLIAISPFFIAFFWREISNDETFGACITCGLRAGRKLYRKLVLLSVILFGVGFLIMTAFQYMPCSIWSSIAKVLLYGTTGSATMIATKMICANNGGNR